MVEYLAEIFGSREEVDCEVCGSTIDLTSDTHGIFALGIALGGEPDYAVAALCSIECAEDYHRDALGPSADAHQFLAPEELDPPDDGGDEP